MQIPGPDTRVVELRVHGVLGTSGTSLTDAVASVDVAGDGVGRVVRPADRLLRPVPGPTLQAGEQRTVPRIVEGYLWGGMTSGAPGKATWSLLFPFALANVAHWMLPPVATDRRGGRLLGFVLRALLRVVALLLTMLFVTQLTVLTLDLLASQCLAPGSGCLAWWPDALRQPPQLRAAAALLPIVLVVLLSLRLSTGSWNLARGSRWWSRLTRRSRNEDAEYRTPTLPGATVVSDPDTPMLRSLHATGALAAAALLATGGPLAFLSTPVWAAPPAWVAAALIATSVVGVAGLDNPAGRDVGAASGRGSTRIGRAWRRLLQRPLRWALVSLSVVVLASTVVRVEPLAPTARGAQDTVDLLTSAMLALCACFAVLLIPAALLSRSRWAKLPRSLRPWAGGWIAAPVLFLACMLGGGFGAGLALTARQLLGGADWRLPLAYVDVTRLWGTAAVLGAVLAAALLPVVALMRRFGRGNSSGDDDANQSIPPEVALLHAGRAQDQRRAAAAWRWSAMQRRYAHHVLTVLAGVLAVGVVVSLGLRQFGIALPDWTVGILSTVGVATLAGLALGLLRMVYLAVRHPDTAHYLSVLCNLALFWPRDAHPIVPPCYALKAIPEIAARAAEHLKDPNTRVVLSGHSHGSLLAAVAASRLAATLPAADLERVGLITAGSQLQWAYSRAFPDVVPHSSLLELSGQFGDRWRSLCRGTDPLGGGVCTWGRQVYDSMLIGVGFRGDGTEGPLPAATRGPTGALVLGADHWLPDPQRGPFPFRRWKPGVLGHTEYSSDPEWDRAVAMATGLESPVRSASLPLRDGSPVLPTLSADPPRGTATAPPAPATPDAEAPADAEPLGAPGTAPARTTIAEETTGQSTPAPRVPTAPEPDPEERRARAAPWERAEQFRAGD